MAYVAISQGLREDVRRKINSLKAVELGTVPPSEDKQHVSFITDDHLKLVWGPYYHLMPTTPPEWAKSIQTVRLQSTKAFSFEDGFVEVKASRTLEFNPEISAPPNADRYGFSVTVSNEDPDMAALLEAGMQRHAVKRKWDKIERQVTSFLVSCKSLNEGLKLWPDLRIYIPQSYLDRVELKVAREKSSAAADALKNVDTDLAVSSAVTARFMSATSAQE